MWLSREDSNEAGKYHTDRAPYQKEPLDTIGHPNTRRATLIWASQLGKTLLMKIVIAYYMKHDPASILYLMPTLDMSRVFSKERISPMLRDVPALRGLVREPRAKDSTNQILHKTYPGGHLSMVGSNAPASLASRPVRIVIGDERAKYKLSAGDSGDPFALAVQRTQNFENRKVIDIGTPGIKDIDPLEQSWEQSDQRLFLVPCPHCGHDQQLIFGQLKFERTPGGKVTTVHYECSKCRSAIVESDKGRLLRAGKWVAQKPENADHPGFHLSALYSPWLTWKEFAQAWVDAKRSNNPEVLKQVINEKLAEWWDDQKTILPSDQKLMERLEDYTELPEGVLLVTAAADVQDDRIEVMFTGWGEFEEKWHSKLETIPEKPSNLRAWTKLDEQFNRRFRHASGIELGISAATVDSGGHFTQQAYNFVKPRQVRRIFATKGRSGIGLPIITRPTTSNKRRVLLFTIGVDTAKELIYAHLTIDKFGPNYIHFNKDCDEEYFRQLTAEKLVTKWSKGRPTRSWVKIRARNEVLDLWVGNYAAYQILNPDIDKFKQAIKRRAVIAKTKKSSSSDGETTEPTTERRTPPPPRRPKRRRNFAMEL